MPSTLLGYDWAAAVADDSRQRGSRAYLSHKEDHLSSLSAFRRDHSSACVGPSRLSDLDAEIQSLNPKLDFRRKSLEEGEEEDEEEEKKKKRRNEEAHVCVFPYEIGERLFARPLITGKESTSVACPICGKGRPPSASNPTNYSSSSATAAVSSSFSPAAHYGTKPDLSAAVVKITLDRGRLLPDYSSPYIPEARRRKSFDSSNSMSLASHLLKGSRPLRNSDVPPTTKSLSLRRNLRKEGETKKGGGGGGGREGGGGGGGSSSESLKRNLRSRNCDS